MVGDAKCKRENEAFWCRYDLWRLGPFRIISRASVRASHAVEGAYAVPLTVSTSSLSNNVLPTYAVFHKPTTSQHSDVHEIT